MPYLPTSTPPVASPRLDCPPLSPSTLNLLAACIAPSPTFDSISPEASLHPTSSRIPISLGLSQSGISSIHHSTPDNNHNPTSFKGSFPIPPNNFNILAFNPWNSSPSPQEVSQGNQDPFQGHPDVPWTSKARKSKCVKTLSKDINLRFVEGIIMGKVVDTTNRVLVCHVRGRTYSAKRLRL